MTGAGDRIDVLARWAREAGRGEAPAYALLACGDPGDTVRALAAEAGIAVVDVAPERGAGALAAERAADAGIGAVIVTAAALPEASAAVCALLTRANAAEVTAPAADDTAWMDSCERIRATMLRARPAMGDTAALLDAVGDAPLRSAAEAIAAASRRGLGVVLDDAASCAAALAAAREQRTLARTWIAGTRTDEPAQHRALDWLELEPVVDLRSRTPGVGAIAAVAVVRTAAGAT